ncbi:MAG: lysophospholipid acyltransferase family protein [Planctomycetota bacterium]
MILRILILVLEKVVRFLPWRLVVTAGAFLGGGAYVFQVRRRRRALANLTLALGDTKDPGELRRLARRLFLNIGRNLADIVWVAARPERCDGLVTFEGLENLEAARARGRGVVLVSGHAGSWELMAAAIVRHGLPLSVIARRTSQESVSRFVLRVRERLGVQTVLRGSSAAARTVQRTLRAGDGLASLIDQDVRVTGVVVDFFGRPALTPTGPISLALRAGSPLVYFITWRLPGGTHQVRFDPPIEMERGGDTAATVERNTAAFTLWLEERIREHPDQWMWIHRRWRRGARRRARADREQAELGRAN